MEAPLNTITYSSGTTLCHCERKYYWRYEANLVPLRDDSEARWVGSAMHAGQEALVTGGMEAALAAITAWADQPAIGVGARAKIEEQTCKARAMVRASAERWPIIGETVEHVVSMPLVNPDTGRSSRSFVFHGKFDGLVNECLYDWKNAANPQRMLREKTIGYQTECYAMAAEHMGMRVTSAQFRIIARPTLQFCKSGEYTKKYGGDHEAYEQACYEWLLDDPAKMVEHEVYINAGRMDQARHWLWSVGKRILSNRLSGRWMCNELACHSWNRECPYMPLCEVAASGGDVQWLADQQYEHREPHEELAAPAQPQ